MAHHCHQPATDYNLLSAGRCEEAIEYYKGCRAGSLPVNGVDLIIIRYQRTSIQPTALDSYKAPMVEILSVESSSVVDDI